MELHERLYRIIKMSDAEILEENRDAIVKNAEEMAAGFEEERKNCVKKRTKYGLLGFAVIFMAMLSMVPVIKSGGDSEYAGMIFAAVGSVAMILFFVFLIKAMSYRNKAFEASKNTDVNALVSALIKSTRASAIGELVKTHWLCPHCSAPNPLGEKTACSVCGAAYNDKEVARYRSLALSNCQLPPVLKPKG